MRPDGWANLCSLLKFQWLGRSHQDLRFMDTDSTGNRKANRYCGRKQCDMSLLPPTLHTASGTVMTPGRRLVCCCGEDV
jgi:hypothetical protein